MFPIVIRSLALALAAASASPAASTHGAQTIEIRCPETIAVEGKATVAPPGWKVHRNEASPILESVTFFEGPVDEKASLAPDSEPDAKGAFTLHWTLPASPRGYSLVCGYARTSFELVQPLSAAIRSCAVTYNPATTVSGLPSIVHIACQ